VPNVPVYCKHVCVCSTFSSPAYAIVQGQQRSISVLALNTLVFLGAVSLSTAHAYSILTIVKGRIKINTAGIDGMNDD
jgi:hypothetical protein